LEPQSHCASGNDRSNAKKRRVFVSRWCFPHGKTILVLTPAGASVKHIMHDATLADVSNREISVTAVDMNKIIKKVDDVLQNERT
jgi:hypothetical protein